MKVEEIVVIVGSQRKQVDRYLVARRRGAVVAGQMIFHNDVMPDIQVEKFIVTIDIGGHNLHEHAGRAGGGGVGIKIQRDVG